MGCVSTHFSNGHYEAYICTECKFMNLEYCESLQKEDKPARPSHCPECVVSRQ